MHFRFRGNNIQVVRSQPDAETGRAKSVPLGSINRATLQISEKLRANCSTAELEEITVWVERYHKVEALKQKFAAVTLPEQISSAAQWFTGVTVDDESRRIAGEAAQSMAMLRRILNKLELL